MHPRPEAVEAAFTLYVGDLVIELAQALTIVHDSNETPRDAGPCPCFPIMPLAQSIRMVERTWGFSRAPFEEDLAPPHGRRTTWKW